MTEISLIYVTTRSTDQARTIANELLERKLIACANILPQMESLYLWQGKIETALEAVLILKSRDDLIAQVVAAVEELHDYDTPCALQIKVESGSKAYLAWLNDPLSSLSPR